MMKTLLLTNDFIVGMFIGYIIVNIFVCGFILGTYFKYRKQIKHIINDYKNLSERSIHTYSDISALYNQILRIKEGLYDETNFIKDKLGIVIRNTNNIRDNVQVTKLNSANILKQVEKENKAKISYNPVKPKKLSDNNLNGQEKLKTAKNNENQHDNVRKYTKD